MPKKPRDPGSITSSADSQHERISGISSVSQTITQMQKSTQRHIDETRDSIDYGASPDWSSKEMSGVLSKFGQTISAFTKGIETVTLSSARATKDAIGEYGRAISQDINYNKQNIVAMALSRSTPIFGYFAAKFMETDVFKKAKARMSESIASVFKSVGSGIANIFRGKEKASKEEVPKMQKGGYVQKGGMVEVHPAEVIMPIEKVLERIDETISVAREVSEISQKTQLHSLAKMSTFVEGERQKEPVGMVKGFLRALREVNTQYEEPANIRLLRAVLAIQDTLGATIGTWQQVWTKMLVEHPFFRQAMFGMRMLSNVFSAPFKVLNVLFKQRGGYRSRLSRSKNPFEQMTHNIAQLYLDSMHRLDNIALYTRASATMIRDLVMIQSGGKVKYPKIEAVGEGTRSILGWLRFGMHNILKWGPGIVAGGFDIMLGGDGKGAWKMGRKFGDWITREIEWGEKAKWFLKSKRQKSLDFALGEGRGFSGGLEELLEAQKKQTAPPLMITYTPDLQEKWEEASEAMVETSKGVWESADQLDKHNKRERRKGVMGFLGMIGGGAWSLLKGAGGFLQNLLGLGKGGWLSTAITGLFAANGPILSTLTSPAFLGPLGAAIGGVAVGTWINNNFIKPWIDQYFNRVNDANREAEKRMNERRKETVSAARGDTATGAEAYQARVAARTSALIQSQQGSLLYGGLTSEKALAVRDAQEKFIKENQAAYSKYSIDEIEKARTRWQHSLGYFTWYKYMSSGKDPAEFGREKEASFLKYLQNVGTKSTEEQLNAAISEHEAKIYASKGIVGDVSYLVKKYGPKAKDWVAEKGNYAITKAGQIVDKATGKIMDVKDIAEMEASELMASAQLVSREMKARGMEGVEGLKAMGDKIGDQLNNVSNVVSQQMSNISNIYNNGAERAGQLYDEMKQRVVTGNYH